jgi:hypothetical protein
MGRRIAVAGQGKPTSDDRERSDSPEPAVAASPPHSLARETLKKLVLGALATSGGLAVIGWHSQAHGNRSSHLSAEIRWDVDRYVFERENLLAPGADTTLALRGVISALDEINLRRSSLSQPLGTLGITASQAADLTRRNLEVEQVATRLRAEQLLIQRSMLFRPITARVLEFLRDGRVADAINTIQAIGSAEQVLEAYVFTQLDLSNASVVEGRTTTSYAEPIRIVSEAGVAFARSLPQSRDQQVALAGLLNNFASMMVPDRGTPTADSLRAGERAAADALAIREALGDPAPIMFARFLVGLHAYAGGQYQLAAEVFGRTVAEAQAINDQSDAAWALAYQGMSEMRATGVADSGLNRINQAIQILDNLNDQRTAQRIVAIVREQTGRRVEFR